MIDMASVARIEDTTKSLQAIILRDEPTVDNWVKTEMSSHVVRLVNYRVYPSWLCKQIKEEYPEWFI